MPGTKSQYPRISAKNLGLLKLPAFCPRCFWLEMKLWRKNAPFRFRPPGLFNKLDAFQKAAIIDYWVDNSRAPAWLGPFKSAEVVLEGTKLAVDIPEFGLTLSGIPDLLLGMPDGEDAVIDQKTAYFKDGNDPLRPMYEVQLNAYAYLANRVHPAFQKVTRAGFAYFEGQTEVHGANPIDSISESGQLVEFSAKIAEIEIDPENIIPPLLEEVSELLSQDEIPPDSAECNNCAMLAQYLEIVAEGGLGSLSDIRSLYRVTDASAPTVSDLWDPED